MGRVSGSSLTGLPIVAAVLLLAGCACTGEHETRTAGCGDSLVPRLLLRSLPPGELPDDCMMQWVRRGGRFSLGTYAPPQDDLVEIGGGHLLRGRAAEAFRKLQAEAVAIGHTIVPVSGYRSHERQAVTHEKWVHRRLAASRGGVSRSEVVRAVDEFSARAGHSEHQLGTTVDVSAPGVSPFNRGKLPSAFATSCAGKWVRENAHRFGFTMSYRYGREQLTCMNPEPWHFRYVGVSLATRLYERAIALEEYFREQHPDITVPVELPCPPTRPTLQYEVPSLSDCPT